MIEIVKLQAKQTVNNTLYHRNEFNIILVYNLPLNSKVLVWRKSGNQTRFYYLLAIKDKTYYIQLPSGLTNFRSIFVKPYFQFKNTYNIKPKILAKLDKLKTPLPTPKIPYKLTEPIKPIIKYS